jgi:fucose permease
MPPVKLDRPLVAVGFAVFVVLGLSAGVTGVAWPSMRSAFSRPVADLGVLLAIGTVGYFIAGLAAGRLTARFGLGNVLTLIMVVGTASLAGYGLAGSWPLLLACAIGVGFSGGITDSVVNAYVALYHGTRTMNLLHAFFGIGATIGPVMVASLLSRGMSWRTAYFVLAGVGLLLVFTVMTVRNRWPAAAGDPESEGLHGRFGASVASLLGLFVLYVGIEVAAGQWAYSVLTESRGMAEFAAGIWVALYWGGLTGGRLALGVLDDRVGPRTVLHVSMIGSVIGSMLFWLDPAGFGVVGLALLGVSLAGVFPILVALTPSWVGEDRAPAVIGYQIAAAAAGAALIPWVAGLIVDGAGLESVGPFLVAIAVAMAVVHWLIDRAANGQSRLEQSRSPFSRATNDRNSSQP